MTHPPVGIVILAAGSSSRLGRPKQLLELGGEPLIRHAVRNALASSAVDVVLVLGSRAEEIARAAGDGDHRTIINSGFALGQSTSMVAGIAALDNVDAALMMLGDQPTVGADLLNQLIATFARTRAAIVQPRYQGKPGNPVLFGRELFPELMQVAGDQGARGIVKRRSDQIAWVDVDQPVPQDVDSEADYERLKAIWAAR